MSSNEGYTRHIRMSDEEVRNLHAWKGIVAKAWTDDQFRTALIANPDKVLAENGFQIPAGLGFQIVEDTDTVRHLILPPRPAPGVSVTELGKNSDYDPGF